MFVDIKIYFSKKIMGYLHIEFTDEIEAIFKSEVQFNKKIKCSSEFSGLCSKIQNLLLAKI